MKDENKDVLKHNTKDSVFCDLFSYPEYQLQLYRALHPEDDTATEADITTVTLKSLMLNHLYNDLGFMVRDRLIILVEEQSSWSINIVVRVLLYFAEEWKKHIADYSMNPYGSKKLALPRPEFYVIYTGHDREGVKDEYSLADEFLDGDGSVIDVHVRVIKDGAQGDIISQYVGFTRVFDSCVRKYGRVKKAIEETIRICMDRDLLKEYLSHSRQEVTEIMDVLFDQDWLTSVFLKDEREEAKEEGADENALKAYNTCLERGMSEEDAIAISHISDEALTNVREDRKRNIK